MKFLAALALALPTSSVMAKPIRDPEVHARVRAQHDIAMEKLAKGDVINIYPPGHNETELEGRAVGIVGGLAIVLTGQMASNILQQTAEQLGQYFFNNPQDEIWHNHDYCRTYFDTQGGGNCEIRTYERGSGDRTSVHNPDNGCHWPDAPDGEPVLNTFDDQGIGKYAVSIKSPSIDKVWITTTDHMAPGPNDRHQRLHLWRRRVQVRQHRGHLQPQVLLLPRRIRHCARHLE